MSDVNWADVVGAVATDEGLLVTERQPDGTVGATPRLVPYGGSMARRAPAQAHYCWNLALQKTKDSQPKQFHYCGTCDGFEAFWDKSAKSMGIDTSKNPDGTVKGPLWTSIYFVSTTGEEGPYYFLPGLCPLKKRILASNGVAPQLGPPQMPISLESVLRP